MINIENYGWLPSLRTSGSLASEEVKGLPARVTAVHRERYELICKNGVAYGKLKTGVYYGEGEQEPFPTVGDFVLLQYEMAGDSLIIRTLPRKSQFNRADYHGHAASYVKTVLIQAVAANFDTVFVMTSLNKDFKISRVERYLTLAWQSGAIPVVVLTKADLAEDSEKHVQEVMKIAIDVDVIAVSAVTLKGIDRLNQYLQPGKTIVFLGSSGVGKSSLVNALAGEALMDVKMIREDDSKGRHTTTHRQLIMLESGAMIIDTPGMREIGIVDATEGLEETFADVEELLERGCKFSNCHHQTEPGCVVKSALESGELTEKRWQSYLKLKQEMKFVDDKVGFMNDKKQWQKGISKWSKQIKKNGGFKK